MLWKYFCIKDNSLVIEEKHRKNLQAGNCVKECELIQAKPQEVKDNSYKLSKKTIVKVRSIATFLLTHLGSHPESAQRQYCRTGTTLRGFIFFLEKAFLVLPNQHLLLSWHNRRENSFNLVVVTVTLSGPLLVDTLCWNLLVHKPSHHVKVDLIEGCVYAAILCMLI